MRRFFARIAVVVLLTGLSLSAVAQHSDAEKLEQADAVRLDDWRKARRLHQEVNRSALTDEQMQFYDYFTVLLSTYDGDLQKTYQDYQALLPTLDDTDVRLKAQQSMLILASYIGKWEQGFMLAERLQAELEKSGSESALHKAWAGLASFYQNARQYDLARHFLHKLISHFGDEPKVQCQAKYLLNEIDLQDNDVQVKEIDFVRTAKLCMEAGWSYYATTSKLNRFQYLVKEKEYLRARDLLPSLLKEFEGQVFSNFDVSFYAWVAQLYLHLNEPEQALEYAQKVLKLDAKKEFTQPQIATHKLLAKLYNQSGDYQKAYEAQRDLAALERQFYSDNVTKMMAAQSARFESRQKENEIQLLDKKNRLLTAEAKLSKERSENTFLGLSLASVVLAGLLMWSYRSRRLHVKFRQLSRIDGLTGIFNRAYFYEHGGRVLTKLARDALPASLIMLDVDHFKRINDSYGHQIGDWVLREIVRTIQKTCGEEDIVGRMGGEEFVILSKNANMNSAYQLAERCREAIEQIDTLQTGNRFAVTASFGVSETGQVGYKIDNLVAAADLALYKSKQYGRNQVYRYDIDQNH